MRKRKELRAYQEGGVEFIKRVKRGALFVDPGLGKTTTTLTAFVELMEDWELVDTILIVAPPRVAKETWPREFAEWAHTQHKSYVYIAGTPKKRRQLLKRPADFHIISIDLMLWLLLELGGDHPRYTKIAQGELSVRDGEIIRTDEAGYPHPAPEGTAVRLRPGADTYRVRNGQIKRVRSDSSICDADIGDEVKIAGSKWAPPPKVPYGGFVLDESSKAKNSDTTRWHSLNMMAHMVEYFVLLTGTPASNGLQDLWAQIYLLDSGQRLGSNVTAFRDRWFAESHTGRGYRALGHAQSAIEKALADIVFTLREEDYADLPARMYNNIVLRFDEKTTKQYRKFARELVLEIEGDENSITAQSGAAITNKLLQLSNGIVYRTEESLTKTEHAFHSIKLEAMEDLVEELAGQNLFVAYQFKSDRDRILKKFPTARLLDKKSSTQDEWNRGEIPILLAHPKSAAHGLNLQFGGHHVLWYGPTWSLEDYIQLNKRLHRSGQKMPVMIHHLLVADTMDEDVMKALHDKNDVQETLLNSLKSRIRSYKNV